MSVDHDMGVKRSSCAIFVLIFISVREFQSVEYRFWNVHGDSLVSAIPKYLHDKQIDMEDEEGS